MPFINGCYVSKRRMEQDTAFLKDKGLSDDYIAANRQRICR